MEQGLAPVELKFEEILFVMLFMISVGSGVLYILQQTDDDKVKAAAMVAGVLGVFLLIILSYRHALRKKRENYRLRGIDPDLLQEEARKGPGLHLRG